MTSTLVLGPVRSGKSRHAQGLLARHGAVTVLATGAPPEADRDPEWADRVARHRADRPEGWRTVETLDLVPALRAAPGPVLVDCLGTWLAGVVDEVGAWDDPQRATTHVEGLTDGLVRAWAAVAVGTAAEVVAVSNEVGWGVVPATASGRLFVDLLGRLNARVAAASDRVHLVVAGRVLDLSAAPPVAPGPAW